MKTALITGITGQDGAYLAELLLEKGYTVYGTYRRTSSVNFWRIEELGIASHPNLHLVEYDLTDQASSVRLVKSVQPDEIYNLAAQSFVGVSFDQPLATAHITGLGPVHLLEAIRIVNPKIRFYQASTSELYGKALETPQKETTPFYPRSPYGVAKVYGHWITVNYREAYGMYACNGILFNHESPVRGETFVTRKITRGLARIRLGLEDCLYLGNLNAKRDWGHARDFVEAQWLMLQQPEPEDYVIATGEQHSVREFVDAVGQELDMKITWRGSGAKEEGYDATGRRIVAVDPRYFRPAEVDALLGDASKARRKLGWKPKVKFRELVSEMVREDLKLAERDELVRRHGHKVLDRKE